MADQPASTFTARDGQVYHLYRASSRTAIRDHDGLRTGEALHEYWASPEDDSRRAYVALDGVRHSLD